MVGNAMIFAVKTNSGQQGLGIVVLVLVSLGFFAIGFYYVFKSRKGPD